MPSSWKGSHRKHPGHQQWKEKAYRVEHLWCCCNCDLRGPGAMSMWNDQCPQCASVRCEGCPVTSIKVWEGVGAISTCPVSDLSTQRKGISCETSKSRTPSKIWATSVQSVTSNTILNNTEDVLTFVDDMEGQAVNIYAGPLNNGSPGSDSVLLSSDLNMRRLEHSGALDVVSSTASSPRSFQSSAFFTNGSRTPDTDSAIDSSESSDDDSPAIPEHLEEPSLVQIIDSCILAACGDSLGLGTGLILRVHEALQNWAQHGIRSQTLGITQRGESSSSEGGRETSAMSCSGRSSESPAKRGSENGQTSGRPEKQRKHDLASEARGTESPTDPSRTFACHFCKKDPMKYNFWANRKFKNCPHPSVPEEDLRRIKDHFKTHLHSQCDRCYVVFDDKHALVTHRQMSDPCEKGPSSLKEGIDDGQWEKIEKIIKKPTKAIPKRSDFDKWYDIWEVLFGDVTKPLTPWSEPDHIITNVLPNRHAILREIQAGVEDMIEQGALPRNDQIYDPIFDIIRSALAIETPIIVGNTLSERHAEEGSSLRYTDEAPARLELNNTVISNITPRESATECPQNDGPITPRDQLQFNSNPSSQPSGSENWDPGPSTALDDTASEDWLNIAGMNDGDYDFHAFMNSLQNQSAGYDSLSLLEGQHEQASHETPIDYTAELESDLNDFDRTIPLESLRSRQRRLKGRSEYNIQP